MQDKIQITFVAKANRISYILIAIAFTLAFFLLLSTLLSKSVEASWSSHGYWHRLCKNGTNLRFQFIKSPGHSSFEVGGISVGSSSTSVDMAGYTTYTGEIPIPSGASSGIIGIGTYAGGGKGGGFSLSAIQNCN